MWVGRKLAELGLSMVLGWAAFAALGCTESHDVALASESLSAGSTAAGGSTAGRSGAGGNAAGHAGSAAAGRGGSGGSGSGGRSGAGGAAGRAAAAGSAAMTVTCGADSTECAGTSLLGFLPAAACCTDDGSCGLDLSAIGSTGCFAMNAPGKADASCPAQSLLGFLTFQGCCRPDGTCGGLDTYAGLGCTNALTKQAQSCQP
jgi:hypothetical protein